MDRLAADPDLWKEIVANGTPVIEPGDGDQHPVTFLWRGATGRIRVCWGAWQDMTRLPGTDIWHTTVMLPATTRTVYYFAHDDGSALPGDRDGIGRHHVDPSNPRHVHFPADPRDPGDKDVWASLLELPGAPPEPWLTPPRETAPRIETTIRSTVLGGDRHLTVHSHRPGQPALVVFDGHSAQSVLQIPRTLENLTAAGRIPAYTTIFVHLPESTRDDHLSAVPELREYLSRELMPWARTHLGVPGDGGRNVVAGVSRGGLAAVWAALELPGLFGAAISHSGSFWWSPPGADVEWLTRSVAGRPPAGTRFYLDVGTLEVRPVPGGVTMLDVNRRMRDALRAHGFPVTYTEYAGSHDYVNWRRTFADALQAVLSPR